MYHDEEEIESVSKSIRRGSQWAEGPNIGIFETQLAAYLSMPGVLVCNSGTSALHMAVAACGVKHFHEVIVPSFTFIATVNAVRFVGATPVFADIEEQTFGLDPSDVERKITPKTKAIIAVHYAGQMCKIRELRKIAKAHRLMLIEDGAEALGATSDGLGVGRFGDCAILSFCQNKIVTTGEGGAVITENKFIFDQAERMRSHGKNESGDFVSLGYNFRMADMNAAVGIAQLNKIAWMIKKRQEIASWYKSELGDIVPPIAPYNTHVYQLMTIRIPKRDAVMAHLAENGIQSKVYFNPVHLTPYYMKDAWKPTILPITERVSSEVLSLPLWIGLTQSEVGMICDKVKEVT